MVYTSITRERRDAKPPVGEPLVGEPPADEYPASAQPPANEQDNTVSRSNFRCKRGLAIYRKYATRIHRVAPWVYSVPSQSGNGVYHVYMKAGEESCSCPDWARHHTRPYDDATAPAEPEAFLCKHYFAARLWKAKSEECAACRGRFLVREMAEACEGHLTFYADDHLCRKCVAKHGLGLAS